MKRVLTLIYMALSVSASYVNAQSGQLRLEDIHIRDPFILTDEETKTYYMYSSIAYTFDTSGTIKGVQVYSSKDLETWNEPVPVFIIPPDFWAHKYVWAPEVHRYKGKYYLFVTFTASESLPAIEGRPRLEKRGTQILVADSPTGPFRAFQNRAHTPATWMALDGTFWLEDHQPYMIFCHEWLQVGNGSIELAPLKSDLSDFDGNPITLFKAGDAIWVRDYHGKDEKGIACQSLVTDGPFLYRLESGKLIMIWSSFSSGNYSVGVAESLSQSIKGPWKQHEKPLYMKDGGHAMIFKTFDNRLMLALHSPNNGPDERAHFLELKIVKNELQLAGK